jgi:type I restriction enzyme S subunit
MTINDLRVLVDNLDEYIHIPDGIERLKKTVLHLAVSGQLVPQISSEGTGEDLYKQIQAEKAKLPKKQKTLPEITDTPFDIPKSWKWVRTGDIILQMSGGGTPSKAEPKFWGGGIPWASIKDLNVDTYIEDTQDHITEAGCMSKANLLKPAGSIFIGTRMGVGKIAISTRDMAINQDLKAIKVALLDKLFFLKYFKTAEIKGTAGTTVEGITQDKLLELPFPLPPPGEQKRIVEKVDEIFLLINELDKKYKAEEAERNKFVKSSLRALSHNNSSLVLDNLAQTIKTKADAAELRKAILHLAVSGQLVPQIPSESTGEDLYRQIQVEKSKLITNGKIKEQKTHSEIAYDEIPFAIPKNWAWVRLGDIAQFIDYRGKTPRKTTSGIRLITAKNVKLGYVNLEPEEYISKGDYTSWMTRGYPSENDILFTTEAPLANVALYNFNEPIALAQRIITIHPFVQIGSFLSLAILSPLQREYIFSKATGTTVSGIKSSKLKETAFPLPPLAEQERIVQKATELLTLIIELENQLEE